jgi:hypothetical protein
MLLFSGMSAFAFVMNFNLDYLIMDSVPCVVLPPGGQTGNRPKFLVILGIFAKFIIKR